SPSSSAPIFLGLALHCRCHQGFEGSCSKRPAFPAASSKSFAAWHTSELPAAVEEKSAASDKQCASARLKLRRHQSHLEAKRAQLPRPVVRRRARRPRRDFKAVDCPK